MAIPDASHVFVVHWALMPGSIVTEGDAQYFAEIGSSRTYRLVSARHDSFWKDKVLRPISGRDNILCADYDEVPGKPMHLTIVFFDKIFDHHITLKPVWTLHGDLSTGTCASRLGEISASVSAARTKYAEMTAPGTKVEILAPPQWGGENGN